MPTSLGSWCTALFPPTNTSTERQLAQGLLSGTAKLGNGGTYQLSEHPNWAPQSTADTSGNRNVNSLSWMLPLLYRGVHQQVPSMVSRFRQLIDYWIADHQGKRAAWVDASIYGGLRTETLLCAAQTFNDPYIQGALMRDAAAMLGSRNAQGNPIIGANNTDLIRATGALGAYCLVGDTAHRDQAWGNVLGVVRGIIQNDGSDVEGSPAYAVYDDVLLTGAEKAAATCGISADPVPALHGELFDFVANATRPDFKLESIGDTVVEPLANSFAGNDPRAQWVRSGGKAGAPPAGIYSYYQGGYVFARAGWNPQPGGADTFYSVRYSSTRPATAHTHDDGGAMTVYSRGVEWIGDPGPYRYDNASSLRWFMKSRAAHSSFTVSNVSRTMARKVNATTTTSDWPKGGNDLTCVKDQTWGSVQVTRCVTYVRSIDAIIVTDHIQGAPSPANRGGKARKVTERWQLPPGIGATQVGGVLSLTSGDKRLDMVKAGDGGWQVATAKPGSSVGWFTGAWGVKTQGAVLSRQFKVPAAGANLTEVTVLVPHAAGESVSTTITGNQVAVTRGGSTVTTALPSS